MEKRPYVAFDPLTEKRPSVLVTESKRLQFPLSDEDLADIKTLQQQYDIEGEDNCAGLAAPQIGIAKQVIIFSAPENEELRKWREDFTQAMDKTTWINPKYEGIGEEKREDYEGCFSVLDKAGPVERFCKIRYEAYTTEGKLVTGIAEGFLARIMQHEIDHVHGKLYIDYVPEGKLFSVSEYRKKRAAALDSTADQQ